MSREFSGWGVIATGVLLALLGCYWLIAGWDHIQIERGWSQFIAGAIVLSGGSITIAIGRLIRFLVRRPLATAPAQTASREAMKPPSARPAARAPEAPKRPGPVASPISAAPVAGDPVLGVQPPMQQEAPASIRTEPTQRRGLSPEPTTSMSETAPAYASDEWTPTSDHAGGAEAAEVDRYTAGDSTYVMYADGAVEVRTPQGSRRYESLDALRASSGDG